MSFSSDLIVMLFWSDALIEFSIAVLQKLVMHYIQDPLVLYLPVVPSCWCTASYKELQEEQSSFVSWV